MKILVTRDVSTPRSLTSVVKADGGFYCFGLEPFWDATGKIKPRAISPGTFTIELEFSPKHGRIVPVLQNVPGFTMVEIHWGNFEFPHQDAKGIWHPPDSEGCLVVGAQRDTDQVLTSVPTFNRLFNLLQDAKHRGEENLITYLNAWPEWTP